MASQLETAGYKPLDKGRKRYLSPQGENISRREALKRLRGLSIEQYRLRRAGGLDALGMYTPLYNKALDAYAARAGMSSEEAIRTKEWETIVDDLFSPTYQRGTPANKKQWLRKMKAIEAIWGEHPDLSTIEIRDYLYAYQQP